MAPRVGTLTAVAVGAVFAFALMNLFGSPSRPSDRPTKDIPAPDRPLAAEPSVERTTTRDVALTDVFLYTHIPKTGGASFAADVAWNSKHVNKIVGLPADMGALRPCLSTNTIDIHSWPGRSRGHNQSTCNYVASEGILSKNSQAIPKYLERARGKLANIILLREPESHVISMWAHCRAGVFVAPKDYVSPGSLESWLTLHGKGGPLNHTRVGRCEYNPDNPQTQHLGGDGCFPVRFWLDGKTKDVKSPECVNPAAPPLTPAQTLEVAIAVIESAAAIAINEHYDESVCLALATLRPAQSLTRVSASRYFAECIKLKRAPNSPIKKRRTHVSGNESAEIMTKSMRRTMFRLTEMDRVLYGIALRRFHADLAAIGHPLPWVNWPADRLIVK